MKKSMIAVAVAGYLLYAGTALADEPKKVDDHSGHSSTAVQTETKKEEANRTPTPATGSAETHNMTEDEHKNMSEDSHATHEEASEGGHGHGEVVETPPNIPVLSAFGGINAAFLLYGVWNKWFKKKGGAMA